MASEPFEVVTGAFGYSGKYLTKLLLGEGRRIRTLTNSPRRSNPFGQQIEVHGYNFDQPARLEESLRGASVLYNTYWVRFNHKRFNHHQAVDNTLTLFAAAKRAGVGRIVHVSITRPSEDSPFHYFRGKARLERGLRELGVSYAIVRPTVLFGHEDILVNNIAWTLRRFPLFGVFGDGQYRLQPMHVEDFAALLAAQGRESEHRVVDAIGPETFTYRGLVEEIGRIIGKPRRIIGIPPWLGYLVGSLVSKLVGDVFITRQEIGSLMADLLCTDSPPAGPTRLTDWARQNASTLGVRYASELARRIDRQKSYAELAGQ